MNIVSAKYRCEEHGEIEISYLSPQPQGVGFPTQMFCPAAGSGVMKRVEETVREVEKCCNAPGHACCTGHR